MKTINKNIKFNKNMNYALSIKFHVIFWLIMQVYYFYSMDLFGFPFDRAVQSKLFFLPFQLFAAYFMLFILLGKYLYKGKYIKAIVGFIIFIFVFSYLVNFISSYILNPFLDPEYVTPEPVAFLTDIEDVIADYMRVIFLTPLILICLEFGVSQFQKMKDVEDLIASKNAAELDLLRTQIHPNFLLSTLRNLEQLTEAKDKDGPVVIERLSETLDYILYKGRQQKIALEKEIHAITDYIALENIRFKNATKINLEIGDIERSKLISPLILFSFLEFNFEGYDKENVAFSRCDIKIRGERNSLLCSIKNIITKENSVQPFIYKTEKMKRQLDISYPDLHVLEVKDSQGYYQINLEIKL